MLWSHKHSPLPLLDTQWFYRDRLGTAPQTKPVFPEEPVGVEGGTLLPSIASAAQGSAP